MLALSVLAGMLAAIAVYLALSPRPWQRLAGILVLGQALPILILAAGARAPQAAGAALVVALILFALFIAQAAALRAAAKSVRPT